MSITIKDITRSIKKRIEDNISSDDLFVYFNPTIDTSSNVQVIVKEIIPSNTTSFVVYNQERPDEFISDDIVGRYLEVETAQKKIIAYDSLTGTIELESGFDFEIYDTDILLICYGDTLFLRVDTTIPDNTENWLLGVNVRYYYSISTRYDEEKEKIADIAYEISTLFTGYSYPILDENYNETGEFFYIVEMPNTFSDIETKDSLQTMQGTLFIRFITKRNR